MALAGTLLVASLIEGSVLMFGGWHEHEPRPAARGGQDNEARTALRLLDVPFISQSEALCGGAAASMVLRYWGEIGVQAEDFASLVDRRAGGIRTADLTAAMHARGATAIAANGDAALVQEELAAGRPTIALIEDRPGALHYVVVVGWHERAVVFHDPARTPFVVMRPQDFERRWNVTGNWMLVIAPGERTSAWTRTVEPESSAGLMGRTRCDVLLEQGVRLAQQKDLTAAERTLADATYQCSGAAPLRELAGVRLLQRRWGEVRDLAGRAVALDASDAHAWRLLATSRYIEGDPSGALDAWNEAGEPLLDLVSASGLQRTTHSAVERLLGLEVGHVLTRDDFTRAGRRLDELPASSATRLEYIARGSGRTEVRAHVAEQPVLPRGWLSWSAIAVRTAATRELTLGVNSPSHRGERIEARWRFWPRRPAYGVSAALPAGSLGLLTIDALSEEQPFTTADVPAAQRTGARASVANWATGWFRWEVRGGLDRWAREGTFAAAGASGRVEHRGAAMTLTADAWPGRAGFGAGEAEVRWSSSRQRRGTLVTIRGGLQAVSAAAPLDIWAAGDTGHVRTPLLRAHPVLDNGQLDIQRLGRRLQHGGIEIQHWRHEPGPLALGIAGFLDTARTSRRLAGDPQVDADAGLGLRFAVPGQRGVFRIDIAHGLRDGRNALSVAWQP
jgi:predicted double-glycine peptidase